MENTVPFHGRQNTNKAADNLAGQAFSTGEAAGHALVVASHKMGGGMPESLNALGNMAVGLMHVMAMCVANQKPTGNFEDFDPSDGITPETLLFSALLVNQIAPDYDHNKNGVVCSFGPHVLLETMSAYEKLTGKKPDEFLVPGLVKAVRELGNHSGEVLNAFMERRAHGDSLN